MPLAGLVAAVYRQTTAAGTAFTNQAMTAISGTGITPYTRYQINDTTLRYWDKTQAVTVKKDGVVQTSGFTIEHLSGFVVFTSALLNTDTVTVSGTALTVAEAGGMIGWKLDMDADLVDVTTFADNGWKSYLSSLQGGSGSASAYWWGTEDDVSFLNAGNDVILALYTDDGPNKERFECWAHFKKDSIDSQVKDVVKESIDFTADGKLYYREG